MQIPPLLRNLGIEFSLPRRGHLYELRVPRNKYKSNFTIAATWPCSTYKVEFSNKNILKK